MRYIIDTDWAIDALAGKRDAASTLKGLRDAGVALSIVTVGELYEGPFNSPNTEQHLANLRALMSLFTVLNLNDAIMQRFALVRSQLRRQGMLIADFDLLIGATALEFQLTVLTFNTRHFERIPELSLYQRS